MENVPDNVPRTQEMVTMERLIGHYIFDPEFTEEKMTFAVSCIVLHRISVKITQDCQNNCSLLSKNL